MSTCHEVFNPFEDKLMPEEEEVTQEDEIEVVSLLSEEAPKTQDRRSYQDYVDAEKAESKVTAEKGKAPFEEDTTPDKFKGKSISDVIESYTQLEAELGRRGNEVGDLRKLTDQLLELNEKKVETKPEKKVEVDSLLDDPDTTIKEVVNSNPRLKALERKLDELGVKDDKLAFEKKHPDFQKTMNSPEFIGWIRESPLRQRMLQHANSEYDYEMGTELFDNYNLAKGNAITEATTARDTKASKAAKEGVTEKGGATRSKAKQVFKRSELIHLKLTNPAKYDSMMPEIKKAYIEKRVV